LLGNKDGIKNVVELDNFVDYLNTHNLDRSVLKRVDIPAIRPEAVRTFELGYKGALLDGRLMVDAGYYYSFYKNFIGYRLAVDLEFDSALILPKTAQVYRIASNSRDLVSTQGLSAGANYFFGKYFTAGGNWSWNVLDSRGSTDPLIPACDATPAVAPAAAAPAAAAPAAAAAATPANAAPVATIATLAAWASGVPMGSKATMTESSPLAPMAALATGLSSTAAVMTVNALPNSSAGRARSRMVDSSTIASAWDSSAGGSRGTAGGSTTVVDAGIVGGATGSSCGAERLGRGATGVGSVAGAGERDAEESGTTTGGARLHKA
jgi:hypothetical protein